VLSDTVTLFPALVPAFLESFMKKRSRMSYSAGKRDFARKASVHNVHPKNGLTGGPLMRGGIRL